jgi:hypothetical protein
MCRRQQLQKLDAEQLRWTEAGVPALPWLAGKKVVDKTIIQVWGKHLQQGSRTRLWQLFHAKKTTQKNQLRPPPVKTPIF